MAKRCPRLDQSRYATRSGIVTVTLCGKTYKEAIHAETPGHRSVAIGEFRRTNGYPEAEEKVQQTCEVTRVKPPENAALCLADWRKRKTTTPAPDFASVLRRPMRGNARNNLGHFTCRPLHRLCIQLVHCLSTMRPGLVLCKGQRRA